MNWQIFFLHLIITDSAIKLTGLHSTETWSDQSMMQTAYKILLRLLIMEYLHSEMGSLSRTAMANLVWEHPHLFYNEMVKY